MARSRLLTGAQVFCYINNNKFGRIANFGHGTNTPRRRYKGIDTLIASELIPTEYAVAGNMTIYRLHKDGGAEAAGITATWEDYTREKYFSILIIDRTTDTVLFRATECSIENQKWQYGKGYVMGTISFSALVSNNETVPA